MQEIMRAHSLCILALLWGCAHTTPPAAGGPEPTQAAAKPQPTPEQTEPAPPPVKNATAIGVEEGLLTPLPVAVTSFGAATDGTHLYVAGGYHGQPHDYSREGQASEVRRIAFDGSTSWQDLKPLPQGAQSLALIYHDGHVCRFGGNVATNTSDEPTEMHSSTSASCLNTSEGTWEPLPDLPRGRSSHEATRVGSKVYVAGGWTLSGDASSGQWHDTVEVLDLEAPAAGWTSLPAPMKRRAVGVGHAGRTVVIVGGLTPEGELSQAVDLYDTRAGTWSRGPDYPEDAFGIAVSSMPDGSVVASARNGTLFRWKPGAKQWQRVGDLTFARFFHQLVPIDDTHLAAVGGISGMHNDGRTRHVEIVDLTAKGHSQVVWSMDYDGKAKNRQAAFVRGDHLYLFGGNNSLGQHDFAEHNFVSEGVRIHLPSMRTQRVADFPDARQSMVVVPTEDTVYALGGFGYGSTDAVTKPDVFAFHAQTERWSRVGELPESRTQFGAFATDDALWLLGGLHYDPQKQGEAAFDHRLDVLHGAPSQLRPIEAHLPGARRAFAGALHEGTYYMIGGMREGFQLVEDCTAFSIEEQRFSEIPCPPSPRLSGALVPFDDRLYLVGGSVRSGETLEASSALEAYDPASKRWQRLDPPLPFTTRHAHVLRHGSRILLVSTHNDEGRIHFALVDPSGQAATASVAEATSPGLADGQTP